MSAPRERGSRTIVLVERFIEGASLPIEGVLTAGGLQVFTIFDKPDPLDGPFFEETIYVTPSSLGPASQLQLAQTVQQAADALGLWHGPVHAECRVGPDGIFVLEIAARPIGGLCSKALRFADGSSLEAGACCATQSAKTCRRRRARRAASAVMMIPIPSRGMLGRVDGEAEARQVPYVEDVQMTAKTGQLLEPLPEAGSYLGFIFASAAAAARRGSSRSCGARATVVHDRHDDRCRTVEAESAPGRATWSAAARIRAVAPRLRRRRILPSASSRAAVPLSATASGGTR